MRQTARLPKSQRGPATPLRWSIVLYGVTAWVLVAGAALAQGQRATGSPQDIEAGKQIYTRKCAQCHGDDGKGEGPAAAVVFNQPSLDKYEPLVAPGGVLIVNSSMTTRRPQRGDIRVIEIPANTIAEELGNMRLANIVLTGALLAATGVLSVEAVERALGAHLPERHRHLLPANGQALRRGAALAAAQPA